MNLRYMRMMEEWKDDLEEAKAEAREEARAEKLKEQIAKKLAKGKSVLEIADALEEEEDVIRKLIKEMEIE